MMHRVFLLSLSLWCVISLCDLMNRCVMFWISLYDVLIHVDVIPFSIACWGGPSAHCVHSCKTASFLLIHAYLVGFFKKMMWCIFNLPVSLWWIDLWMNQNAMAQCQTLLILTLWSIWNWRNDKIFRGGTKTPQMIVSEIKETTLQWSLAGCKALRHPRVESTFSE